MVERYPVIDEMHLEHEGLFDFKEMYKLIDTWLLEKFYDKREIKNIEYVEAEGKYIEIWLMPWKKITDYAQFEIRIRIFIKGMKEVEAEKDGIKVKLNQGKISMIFDSYLTTDYEGRWEQKPIFYFLRTIFDKYIYRIYTAKFESGLVADTKLMYSTIKAFLNLHRY